MKILIATHTFYPNVGGIETVSLLLADQLTKLGAEVKVVTPTPNVQPDCFPFEVLRQPSAAQLLAAARWCDVFFHCNISLRTVWPILVCRKPWVVATHGWLARPGAYTRLGWQDHLKRRCIRYATRISVSRAIADHVPTPSVVIGNCYRDDLFQIHSSVARHRDLVFLGRLVSEKGVDILLEALRLLKGRGLTPTLTIIGDGPERSRLERLSWQQEIADQVCFVGSKSGRELVGLLNAHRVMVVPSRYEEPFGVVALEGIACGCVVIGSSGGGLSDAIGPCGVTFPNGDAKALACGLWDLLTDAPQREALREQAQAHLSRHTASAVAQAYLNIFQGIRP